MERKSMTAPRESEFAGIRAFWEQNVVSGTLFGLTVGGSEHAFSESDTVETKIEQKDDGTVCRRQWEIGQLSVRLEAILYRDFPIAEWTIYVKNRSEKITPKVSFTALEHRFPCGYPTIYRHVGSDARPDDHMPFRDPLGYEERVTVAPHGGRSSNHEWPYFSVALGDYGVNVAIGWLGQWEASFLRRDGLYLTARQQRLDSVMMPGEEFRSPRIVLQYWDYAGLSEKKAVRRSQNLFRRYMRAYNMPRYADGSVPTHDLMACSSHQCLEMTRTNAKEQIGFIDAYEKRGVRLDCWWMDAGWYVDSATNWCNLGTWRHDPERFPNGLQEVSDYAKKKGLGIVLWHEPERVKRGSELFEEHPDFLLSPIYPDGGSKADRDYRLLDFGNPEAREWITKRISGNLTEYGVTVYRQDFNTEMLHFVDPSETEERKGAIENHYVCGMLQYWEDLAAEHPGLMLDECASGGRRDDIDALKHAIVFIRSDYLFEPISQQCQMGWFSEWVPYHGTGIMLGKSLIDSHQLDKPYDHYALMSCLSPHLTSCFDPRDDALEWDKIRELLDQWREFAVCYSGDYYPLTEITPADDNWAAWQFNRFEEGDGVIQAFRRPNSIEEERIFALNDLIPEAVYRFHPYDGSADFEMTGEEAMRGFRLRLDAREAAAVKYELV